MPKARRAAAPTQTGPFPFTYDEFADWYEILRRSLLEPARATFLRILDETLDQELSDIDRLRIRVSHSRIKNETRLWNKMRGERYVSRIQALDDIPIVIDDLVGVRVTCNNLSDVETVKNIIAALEPVEQDQLPAGICIDPESERRHHKESGYRAYHINLHTLIQARNGWKPARGELQVRTLLQDSWGELTHEDTYKPGSFMPQLVNKFAKRMADLLATVDDLAQDLRNELDQLAVMDIDEVEQEPLSLDGGRDGGAEGAAAATPENIRGALVAETRRVVGSLTKPATLAQIALQVRADFGSDLASDWGGYGSFKELVRASAPEVTINDAPPGTVIPAGYVDALPPDIGALEFDDQPDGIPPLLYRLKKHDVRTPVIPADRLAVLLSAIADSLTVEVWEDHDINRGNLGIRELNQLSKLGRSMAPEDTGAARRHFDYILKALYFTGNLRTGLSPEIVGTILADSIFSRASRFGLVLDPTSDREELANWVNDAVRVAS